MEPSSVLPPLVIEQGASSSPRNQMTGGQRGGPDTAPVRHRRCGRWRCPRRGRLQQSRSARRRRADPCGVRGAPIVHRHHAPPDAASAADHPRPGRHNRADVGVRRLGARRPVPRHGRGPRPGGLPQRPARGHERPLARPGDPQRHGRRPGRHDPRDPAGRDVRVRLRRPRPGHALVPPAPRHAARPRALRTVHHRRPRRSRRLRRRVDPRARRLDRRRRAQPRRRSWPT